MGGQHARRMAKAEAVPLEVYITPGDPEIRTIGNVFRADDPAETAKPVLRDVAAGRTPTRLALPEGCYHYDFVAEGRGEFGLRFRPRGKIVPLEGEPRMFNIQSDEDGCFLVYDFQVIACWQQAGARGRSG